jgi:ribosomal protein L12E/L44/L45/RPP1/RPP2
MNEQLMALLERAGLVLRQLAALVPTASQVGGQIDGILVDLAALRVTAAAATPAPVQAAAPASAPKR